MRYFRCAAVVLGVLAVCSSAAFAAQRCAAKPRRAKQSVCRGAWQVVDSVLQVPADATEIPAYAFKDRTDIREVRFPAPCALRTIGEYAFLGCSNLRAINIPEGVTECCEGAFRECGIEEASLPATLQKIPKSMFMWCGNLRSVKFGALPGGRENLKDIGSHAFAYCTRLNIKNIPQSVVHIGSNAFSRCEAIEEIQLPRNMEELESYAFSDCISLKRCVMPQFTGFKAPMGELIFSGCLNLQNMEVYPEPAVFDCNSFIFEPDEAELYRRCRLTLSQQAPGGTLKAYETAPGWSLFFVK